MTAVARPAAAGKAAAASSAGKDIWSQLIAERLTSPATVPPREASLLFIGPHSSGKSTLIQSFMFKDREEVPRPTLALDYRYTRTSVKEQMSEEKSLSHFWELGGGTMLKELMGVAVKEDDGVKDALLVVVVDCERAGKLVDDALAYVDMARKKGEQILQQMKANGSTIPAQVTAMQKKRFGESHPDLARVQLMPLQTLLVAHKFDAVEQQGPEELRVLGRTMRAIAHRNGCSLLFTSTQHKEQLNKTFRTRISHHLLGVERKLPPQLNHLEAIVVSAGGDSFAQIGSAKSGDGEGGGAELSGALVDGWVAMYADYFPVKASDAEAVVNLDDLQLLPEPSIDAAVHAKDEELRRKRRELELQRKVQQADRSAKKR